MTVDVIERRETTSHITAPSVMETQTVLNESQEQPNPHEGSKKLKETSDTRMM